MSRFVDLTGRRFFRLVALRKADERYDGHHAFWECQCDCGNKIIVRKDSLESGHAKSCGCYLQERYKDGHLRTHGGKETRLYKIWQGMKQRCLNPKSQSYNNYGGRGITICPEWQNNFAAFRDWARMNGYSDNLSIDRIDVNGNYEPSNCRWADNKTQFYNKRDTQKVLVNGEEMTLDDVSAKYGISMTTVRSRYQRFKKGLISTDEFISPEVLVNKPQQILITVDGVTHNLTEWEKETGVSRKTIIHRYNRGIRSKDELFKKGR